MRTHHTIVDWIGGSGLSHRTKNWGEVKKMINDPAVIFSRPCSIPDGSVNDVFLLHEYSNDWWIDYKKLWWAKTKKCHFCRHHHPLMKHITLLLQALDNFVPFLKSQFRDDNLTHKNDEKNWKKEVRGLIVRFNKHGEF